MRLEDREVGLVPLKSGSGLTGQELPDFLTVACGLNVVSIQHSKSNLSLLF